LAQAFGLKLILTFWGVTAAVESHGENVSAAGAS